MTFDEFFESEHDPLLRMCWAMVTERELARDVAQETMCRAFEHWDQIVAADGARPAAWCRTVALNLIRSNWRRARTASRAHSSLTPHDDTSVEPEPTDPHLLDALRALAPRQREAVVLHHLLDLDVVTCAGIMGIGEPSVKSHLQRGRAHLEVALGDELTTVEA